MTPISLFTYITDATDVSGRSAAVKASGETMPCSSTSRYVTSKPSRSSSRIVSSVALCSVFTVTRCLPLSL